jgi:hypothetical protein
MFYCEPCGYARGWPTDMFIPRSRGKCESCSREPVTCFDVPSKFLAPSTVVPDADNIDPWAEIIPGETAAIESIMAAAGKKPSEKCPACGTRSSSDDEHEPDGPACREMQYERAWKNKEEPDDADDDVDLLA